jgi:hypothetical protein
MKPVSPKAGESTSTKAGSLAHLSCMRTRAPLVKGNAILINPTFRLVFITVVLITILAGAGDLYIASAWATPTGNQQSVFEALGFAWKAGIGAIFGLLGGGKVG